MDYLKTRLTKCVNTIKLEEKHILKIEFPENEKILKGFHWRESERPTSVEDLFKDDAPFVLPTIKGLDAYMPQEGVF